MFFNKRRFTRQYFKLNNSALHIDRKNLFDAIEFEIPFDNIGNKIQIETIVNNNAIYMGIFFFVLGLLFLLGNSPELTFILSSLGILCIAMSVINRKKSLRFRHRLYTT